MHTESINKRKHLFFKHVYKERQITLEEALYSRLVKYIHIKLMERARKRRCEACYTILLSQNMMHGPYRIEGSNAIPFFNLDKICSENTSNKAAINFVVYCSSITELVQNRIHAFNNGRYFNVSSKCDFSCHLHF